MFRTLARLATVLGAVVLSLVLVVVPKGQRADAFVPIPVPIAVGSTLATPAAEMFAAGGAGCVAVPLVCAGLGVGVLGLALYATKDTWIPILKDGVAGAIDWIQGLKSGTSCATVLSTPAWAAGSSVKVDTAWSGCTGFSGMNSYTVEWKDGTCKSGANMLNGVAASTSSIVPPTRAAAGSHSWTSADLCPSGYELVSINVRSKVSTSVGSTYSPYRQIGKPIPSDVYTQTTDVTCKLLDGSIKSLQSVETGHPERVVVPSCYKAYGPDAIPQSVSIGNGWPGTTPTNLTSLTANPTSTFLEKYPNCFTPAGALNGSCRVRVYIGETPCTAGMAGCSHPNQWVEDNPGAQWSCRWGTYVVPKVNCDALRGHYLDNLPHEITTTNPDGTPDTDPSDPPPTTGTSTGTSTGTFPATGANPSTGGDVSDTTDANSSNCFGTGWSWNPVSWVYIPVKCSLKWAFVPRSSELNANVSGIKTAWGNSSPGLWVDAIGGLSFTTPGADSCSGPSVSVDIQGVHKTFNPLDACTGAAANVARVCKLLATAGLVIFGGLGCVRALGSGFGWNPGVGGGGA